MTSFKHQPARWFRAEACDCNEMCPEDGCAFRCLGGHANYPDAHLCAELHQWGDRSLSA